MRTNLQIKIKYRDSSIFFKFKDQNKNLYIKKHVIKNINY